MNNKIDKGNIKEDNEKRIKYLIEVYDKLEKKYYSLGKNREKLKQQIKERLIKIENKIHIIKDEYISSREVKFEN